MNFWQILRSFALVKKITGKTPNKLTDDEIWELLANEEFIDVLDAIF